MTRRRFWVAFFLLAAVVAGYHALPHGRRVPPRGQLSSFPERLGEFLGEEVSLSPAELSALGKGEFLRRVYREAGVNAPILLYVGFFPRQEIGETVHSPQHCLPGGGWEPLEIGRAQLAVGEAGKVEVNRYVVQKGADRLLVLYWFQGRGRVVASEYWSKFYMVYDAVTTNRTDGAVVRLSVPITGDDALAEQKLAAFARLIFEPLNAVIPN